MHVTYLSLGSNMGDKVSTIRKAVQLINQTGARVIMQSKLYATAPYGYLDQDDFVNMSLLVEIDCTPEVFLGHLQDIEKKLDRVRLKHWGPRTIDIDIIWVENYQSQTPFLTVPHPLAFERAFVVKPTLDLPIGDPVFLRALKEAWGKVKTQDIREITDGYKST